MVISIAKISLLKSDRLNFNRESNVSHLTLPATYDLLMNKKPETSDIFGFLELESE